MDHSYHPSNNSVVRLVLMLCLTLVVTGCSSMAKQFNQAFSDEFSGLSKLEAAMISHAVEEVRTQAPASYTSKDIKHTPYKYEEKLTAPELALIGTARNISGSNQFDLELLLDKGNYQHGKLLVTDSGRKETWKIIAFRNQGGYDEKQFEYTYLLTNQEGNIISFSILGTEYKVEKKSFLAYEGALIVPGDNLNWSQWKRAYTIDFGYQIPVKPEFEDNLAEARKISKELSSLISKMDQKSKEIASKEVEIASLVDSLNSNPNPEIEKKIALLTGQKDALSSDLNKAKPDSEKLFIQLIELREKISNNYALFTASNRYTWLPPADQSKYFSRWKGVEKIDKDIEGFSSKLSNFIRIFSSIDNAIDRMHQTIGINNNIERDPKPKKQVEKKSQ